MKIDNRIFAVALASCVIVLSALSTSAQKKSITRSEYNQASFSRWRPEVRNRPHRIESREEHFDNGAVTKSYTSISEGLPPDRTRYYTLTIENGKRSEHEEIKIDYMLYTRNDSGPWTKVDLRQRSGSGYGSGTGSGAMSCVQYTVEDTFLEGVAAKLYESLRIEEAGSILQFSEDRLWIDESGLLRRAEEVRGSLSPKVETYKQITTYDYVPSLKIEAPIN